MSIPVRSAGITRRAAIAGLAGAFAATTACTRSGAVKPIRLWAIGREGDIAAELVKAFVAQNPQIPVEVQKMPVTAAHEKLLTAYAGDTLPDVCTLGNTWVPEFEALNALHPLDDFVAGSSVVDPDDYFSGIYDSNRVSGGLYGVPWYVDTRLLYYRRDILHEVGYSAPPRSWAEWTQMLAAVKQHVGPNRYSVLLPLNEYEPLLVLGLQMPAELLRDGGRYGNFGSPDFRRALTFYNEMFQKGWAPRASNTQISNVHDEFGKGFFSFYISGPWNIAEFKRRLPERLKDAWMTAPMPGPDGPGISSAGGASLVILRASQRKADAWRLVEYLSLPSTQQRLYQLIGNMPPRRSSWKTPDLVQSPYAGAFHEQLDRVRSPPKVPEWERIAQELRLMSERVVMNRSTVGEGVVQLDRKVDEILEKRRWMLARNSVLHEVHK
jgi:multiple sugar transport system substrate-binding protein